MHANHGKDKKKKKRAVVKSVGLSPNRYVLGDIYRLWGHESVISVNLN